MNRVLQSQTFRQKRDFIFTQIAVNMEDMRLWVATFWLCLFAVVIAADADGESKPPAHVTWGRCLSRRAAFYAGDEAIRIADNVLLYQRNTGGWPKNREIASVLTEQEKAKLRRDKRKEDSTLDNGATHTQLRYLAKVYHATGIERFRQAFLRGLDYLLEAQYDNGGWPQYYPDPSGYARHVTFNDGAMIGAMTVLRDVAKQEPPYAFVDENRQRKARAAVRKGIDCILKCQIVVDGRKTAWCAQHDAETFVPRQARSYELPSISGSESVGVVRFLMDIDKPSPEIVEAIQGAVAWFDEAKLQGIRQIRKEDTSKPRGWDKVVIQDASAPAMWARFYEIGTNKPIFCSRDGIPKATLAQISYERRTGYSWLGYYATSLLRKDYPAWQKRWAPEKNVLGY